MLRGADEANEAKLMKSSLFGLTLALVVAPALAQSFPVIHEEPITVSLRDGASGEPLAFAHVRLVAGYDNADLKKQLWREDVLTDSQGKASIPRGLVNFPWLQVWVEKSKPCRADALGEGFSLERIRTEGMSSANRCGIATAPLQPGAVTVFVQSKRSAQKAPDETSGRPAGAPSGTNAESSRKVAGSACTSVRELPDLAGRELGPVAKTCDPDFKALQQP